MQIKLIYNRNRIENQVLICLSTFAFLLSTSSIATFKNALKSNKAIWEVRLLMFPTLMSGTSCSAIHFINAFSLAPPMFFILSNPSCRNLKLVLLLRRLSKGFFLFRQSLGMGGKFLLNRLDSLNQKLHLIFLLLRFYGDGFR